MIILLILSCRCDCEAACEDRYKASVEDCNASNTGAQAAWRDECIATCDAYEADYPFAEDYCIRLEESADAVRESCDG